MSKKNYETIGLWYYAKAGERVRLTRKNGDVYKLTVQTSGNSYITTADDTKVYKKPGDKLERLLPPTPPLPTKPGLYSFYKEDTPIYNMKRALLTTKGQWYTIDFTATTAQSVCLKVEDVNKTFASSLGYELTPVYTGKATLPAPLDF